MSNIVLVGIMGSGKSTVARVLSKKLNMKWLDTDHMIESQSGKKITDLFNVSESYFRSWEHSICNSLQNYQNHIISTGGGIIINPNNRALLKKLGIVIYLSISANAVINRLKNDTKRPLLQHENKLEIIQNLLVERDPLYNEVSTLKIDVDQLSIDQVTEQIIAEREKLI